MDLIATAEKVTESKFRYVLASINANIKPNQEQESKNIYIGKGESKEACTDGHYEQYCTYSQI